MGQVGDKLICLGGYDMSKKFKLVNSDGSEELIDNKINVITDNNILVDKNYLDLLIKNNIPYSSFSTDFDNCFIVRQGVKKKRFSPDEVKQIEKDLETMTITEVSSKYNCGFATIHRIKHGNY
ncbi:hypothetical protein BGV21_19615 [Clostridioides difficile]|uniref:hypothetical protein n=2 Tax=Clostridioides difficile TaxID=1496 RepID=UPI000BB1F2C0|nr:hypothetical protein [Clostridioides difficile]PBH23849.1 hypothetical protein BGV21_19615 [Clostridioides difficile]